MPPSMMLMQVLSVNNPLHPDALITYCHSSNMLVSLHNIASLSYPLHSLILQRALTEFDSLLTLLQPYS